MQIINISSIAAAHEVASTIEGYGGTLVLLDSDLDATVQVEPDRDSIVLRFVGEDRSTAAVSIFRAQVRDEGLRRATVTWSAHGAFNETTDDAAATARLLGFAAQVAAILTDWAARGQLDRVNDAQWAAYGRQGSGDEAPVRCGCGAPIPEGASSCGSCHEAELAREFGTEATS